MMKMRSTKMWGGVASGWMLLLPVLALVLLGSPIAMAQSDPIIVTTRTFTPLAAGTTNVIDPTATTVDVTVTFTDVNPDPLGSKALTSFGFKEDAMPTGWTFNSTVASPPSDTFPSGGNFALGWFYIAVPTLPFSFTYRLNVNAAPLTDPFDFTGLTSFSTDGGGLSDPSEVSTVYPGTVTVSRAVTAGLCSAPNLYADGTTLTVALTIDGLGNVSTLSTLGVVEDVPTGWVVDPLSVTGADGSLVRPNGDLEVFYIAIPAFPVVVTYDIDIPAAETGTRTFSAAALYRFGAGAEITGASTSTDLVDDANAPLLTLNGTDPVSVQCGTAYTDAGATATDVEDGNLDASVVVDASAVDTSTPGTYTVNIDVADACGNTASDTRTVNVIDTVVPVIVVSGTPLNTMQCGGVPPVFTATATDSCVGNLDASIVVAGDVVDPATPGVYVITYNVADGNGNNAVQVTRTVTVEDTGLPVITLNGGDVTVECGGAYTELGATASDSCDLSLPAVSSDSSAVDETTPGVYPVNYSVTDSSGNTGTASLNVTVVDTTDPIISLNGTDVTIECGTSYVDAGATASDSCDTSLGAVATVNPVPDPATVGVFTVTYDISDSSGNAAAQVTRTVTVEDTTAPVISAVGTDSTIECGTSYVDAGATASDTCEGDLSASIATVNNVPDPATVGTFTVTYDVSDAAGNAATQVVLTITVVDTTEPVITLVGTDVTVECGTAYVDAGATAADSCEGDLTASILTDTSAVDTSTPGVYTVDYAVSDSATNAAVASRTVTVVDTTDPVITLLGAAAVSVDCQGVFTDAGATATDSCAGSLTASVVVGGTVDTTTPGVYTLTYNVSDADGNAAAQVTRTVTVLDNCAGEGEGEGEGEPLTPCDVASITILRPIGNVLTTGTVANVLANADVIMDDCRGPVEVTYDFGGAVTSTSTDRGNSFPGLVSLPLGTYTMTATATSLTTGNTATDSVTFSVVQVVLPFDADDNGIPDDIFDDVPDDGDTYTDVVDNGVGCDRAVAVIRISGDALSNADVFLQVANPADPTQIVSVRIPRGVVLAGEEAIAILQIACDLPGLFSPLDASPIAAVPSGQVAGANTVESSYFDLSIIVTNDGGATFFELDTAEDLNDESISLRLSGLGLTGGLDATFLSHPTNIDVNETDAALGLHLEPTTGSWSDAGIRNPTTGLSAVNAQTTALSVFSAFEGSLRVLSAPDNQFVIGIVEVGKSQTEGMVVKNVGDSVISATASLEGSADISIVSGTGSFTLDPNETFTVLLTYAPGQVGVDDAVITFDSLANPPKSVGIKGEGVKKKAHALFGCAPATDGATGGVNFADLAIVAVALLSLILVTRVSYRLRAQS